jgi:fumarate hydratase subunit beta
MVHIELKSPLSESDVRKLNVGDIVYISGYVFTGRTGIYTLLVEKGVKPPIDFTQINVMWHLGPVMKKIRERWKVVAAGATTSIRFEKWAPELIRRFKIRALIGKGSMGPETLRACKEVGCVHLGKVSMATGALYMKGIEKVIGGYFLELGTSEALWVLKVKKLGPLVVTMDAKGNDLYKDIDNYVLNEGYLKAQKKLGIEGFEYAKT